uniref:SLAM family member 6 n=2 Tax=Molossus molossus TaxID=27622 RepID=A0A7J8D288_MOLMO|nr:SLAM family member 6 [Molossus molossus]
MIWLFQFLTLVSYPGNTDSQTSTTSLLVKGVLGASVTLPLKFPEGQQSQSITWLHDGTSIIFIQTMKERIQVTDPQEKDRLNVTQSYSFHYQISNLIMEDSGPYHAQLTTTTSTVISNYSLEIFRQLRNLQVANHTQLFENGTCEIHLTCSVENPNDHISLWWQVPGNTTLEEANPTISCNPKNSNEQTYTCIANNTVSNAFFSFSIQSLCKGVFNEKNQYLVILWIIMVPSFLCITVCLIVWRKKIAGSFSIQQTQSPVETSRNSEYVPLSPGRTV